LKGSGFNVQGSKSKTNPGTPEPSIKPRTLKLEGKVKEWESWTSMRFKESGEYVVGGAQSPVIIDHINDCGGYAESFIGDYSYTEPRDVWLKCTARIIITKRTWV